MKISFDLQRLILGVLDAIEAARAQVALAERDGKIDTTELRQIIAAAALDLLVTAVTAVKVDGQPLVQRWPRRADTH